MYLHKLFRKSHTRGRTSGPDNNRTIVYLTPGRISKQLIIFLVSGITAFNTIFRFINYVETLVLPLIYDNKDSPFSLKEDYLFYISGLVICIPFECLISVVVVVNISSGMLEFYYVIERGSR